MKYVIIGGVAAGASAAARLRRLDEKATIVLFERGPYISYANCGLPYKLGGKISERDNLLVMPEPKYVSWLAVDVRSSTTVTQIDRENKKVIYRQSDGVIGEESYDKLLLAPGSTPIRPPLPGIDNPLIHTLWSIPDMDSIDSIAAGAKEAIVVGAGAIGLETAENLAERNIKVTIAELGTQILPIIDPEMTHSLEAELAKKGIEVKLGHSVVAFDKAEHGVQAKLDDGTVLNADIVILSIGVKPQTELAKEAGLELGPRGHIIVDDKLQTSDSSIWAAGDAIEVRDPILGGKTAIALAGPANKQGRIAADNMAGGDSTYKGTFGASIVKVGALAAASVGYTERRLVQAKAQYRKLYLHPNSSAGYYPGGSMLDMKLLFDDNGKILGAQAVGITGVDKRIDDIAITMRLGGKVQDLTELELAYAPPFNSAKDPVNFAGFIATDILSGYSTPAYADALPQNAQLIDIRQPEESELGTIPNAINIPLPEIRNRLGEIRKDIPVIVFCQVGLRGYLAERILKQNGFDNAYNLSGGYRTWKQFNPDPIKPVEKQQTVKGEMTQEAQHQIDVRGLACPGPIIRTRKEIEAIPAGSTLRILAPMTFAPDLTNWSHATGNKILSIEEKDGYLDTVVQKAGTIDAAIKESAPTNPPSRASIVLFSNDLDKAMAALIIACGMAAQGTKVSIFFTFWGLSVLRKTPAPRVRKNLISKLFGLMLPSSANKLALSKLDMMGMGRAMMKQVMKKHKVSTVPELLADAKSLGVEFLACEMAMGVMGITREELIEVDDVVGVASFTAKAQNGATLFI